MSEGGVACSQNQVWKESVESLSDKVEGTGRLVPHEGPSRPINQVVQFKISIHVLIPSTSASYSYSPSKTNRKLTARSLNTACPTIIFPWTSSLTFAVTSLRRGAIIQSDSLIDLFSIFRSSSSLLFLSRLETCSIRDR